MSGFQMRHSSVLAELPNPPQISVTMYLESHLHVQAMSYTSKISLCRHVTSSQTSEEFEMSAGS